MGDISYRALGAVLDVVHRQLDLRLLSDQRVLEECYTTQIDRITGTLWRERERGEKREGDFCDESVWPGLPTFEESLECDLPC